MKTKTYLFGSALDALYEMTVTNEESFARATVRYAEEGEWTQKGAEVLCATMTSDGKIRVEMPVGDPREIEICDAYPLAEALAALTGHVKWRLRKVRKP